MFLGLVSDAHTLIPPFTHPPTSPIPSPPALLGLFTFAVFLGLVSDEVKRSFRDIKDGLYPVRLHGHVLILNWSRDAIPLLR